MNTVRGLHHVTAIAGPPQENVDFYAGVLGMRLVKRSVNQDDPGTYHLFYADAEGNPGTDITFFPWSEMAPSRSGWGLSSEVSLAIPSGSLSFWSARLEGAGVSVDGKQTRFGQDVMMLSDPHGLHLALVESNDLSGRKFSPWEGSPIPVEHQIRGLESARMVECNLVGTVDFLVHAMGFIHLGSEAGWHRYGLAGGRSGEYVDICEAPNERRGAWGTGRVHHLAWRVDDQAHQEEVRNAVIAGGIRATQEVDRFWFKSVYFPEPGGVLFELATDGPGFAVDEDPAQLGKALVLPPWLEARRKQIEAGLPKLTLPATH